MRTILFHGQAGSGKDTQVEMLLKEYPVERIASGDMFRTLKEEGDLEAIKLSEKVEKGIWPNPAETYSLLLKWFKRFDNSKDWMLISVARYADQIPFLDEDLLKFGRKLDIVIHFKLSEEVALKRLAGREICPKCQATYHPEFKIEKKKGVCDYCKTKLYIREDDKPEAIHKRFEQYSKTIDEFLRIYRERGLLVEIDASGSIESIHQEVLKVIGLSK